MVDIAAERYISNKISLYSISLYLSRMRRIVNTFFIDIGSATKGVKMLNMRWFIISGKVKFICYNLMRAYLTLSVLGQKVEYLNS